MQRIATFTALAAIAGAAAVAFSGAFAPEAMAAGGAVGDAYVIDPSIDPSGGDVVPALSNGLDRNSAGILAGAFVGAAVALLSHTLVATALKLSTEAAFKALIVGFFAKCAGAILPWGALSYVPQVGRLADPTAYLVAFAIVVVLVLGGGLFDHLAAVNAGVLDGHEKSADKSPTEIGGGSSDRASGSASSSPETSMKSSSETLRSPGTLSTATVPSSVHPLGSGDTLESAT